jgi:lysozyme
MILLSYRIVEMRTNKAGLNLIKEFEGFRTKAYKCPAGVWTIGYGHTSMAGPPAVKPGMVVSRTEAEAILRRDLKVFEDGVKSAIKVQLNSNQFSACVSLCYNIGVGAFSRSSVARFCNKGQWKKAADAFALWNKAGGKVLPGLTRRRAAEAALFSKNDVKAIEEVRPIVDEPKGKPMTMSTTNLAAGATAAAGVTAAAKDAVENGTAIFSGFDLTTLLIVIIVAGALWIVWERYKKARDWDV